MGTRERLAEHFPVVRTRGADPPADAALPGRRRPRRPRRARRRRACTPTTPCRSPSRGRGCRRPSSSATRSSTSGPSAATLQGDAWNLPLVTVVDGEVVGSQGVFDHGLEGDPDGRDRLVARVGGSRAGASARRCGSAILHLAFDGFGAERAVTAAYADNPASLAVTASLGYRPNGDDRDERAGRTVSMQHFAHGSGRLRASAPRRRRDRRVPRRRAGAVRHRAVPEPATPILQPGSWPAATVG